MKKVLKCEIPLLTPTGKVLAPIQIVYDDTEVIVNPSSEITLCYNGNEYKGCGTDYLWTDTLADLVFLTPTYTPFCRSFAEKKRPLSTDKVRLFF